MGHTFQSVALFLQKSALMVKLSAAGGSPAVDAKAWFWAPAEREGDVSRQVMAPARVSSVPRGAADAIEVISTLAMVAFAVAQLIFVFRIAIGTQPSLVTASSAWEVALGAKSVGNVPVVCLVFVSDEAVLVTKAPVTKTAGLSFLVFEFPLLTLDAQVGALLAFMND